MSAILKFDFQKRKQLHFSEVNYLYYTKKDPILHVTTTFSLRQGETRTNSVPIPHPLNAIVLIHAKYKAVGLGGKSGNNFTLLTAEYWVCNK